MLYHELGAPVPDCPKQDPCWHHEYICLATPPSIRIEQDLMDVCELESSCWLGSRLELLIQVWVRRLSPLQGCEVCGYALKRIYLHKPTQLFKCPHVIGSNHMKKWRKHLLEALSTIWVGYYRAWVRCSQLVSHSNPEALPIPTFSASLGG